MFKGGNSVKFVLVYVLERGYTRRHGKQIIAFKCRLLSEGLAMHEDKQEVTKLVSLVKMAVIYQVYSFPLTLSVPNFRQALSSAFLFKQTIA